MPPGQPVKRGLDCRWRGSTHRILLRGQGQLHIYQLATSQMGTARSGKSHYSADGSGLPAMLSIWDHAAMPASVRVQELRLPRFTQSGMVKVQNRSRIE